MTSIEIAQEKQIPELINLVQEYKFKDTPFTDEIKNSVTALFQEALTNKNSWLFIYTDNNAVLGYINCHIIPFPMINGNELYISDLLVSENARGKGVGKQLLTYIELFARNNGCKRLMLNNAHKAASYQRAFYKKNGFTERTEISNFVKELQ